MASVPTGKHVWYDLMTTDVEGAKDFYGKVVGWDLTPFEGAPEPYDMWTAKAGPIGGVMSLPEEARSQGAPTHWVAYIATPDLDATVTKAQEMGGKLLAPVQDMPEVGRFAFMQDPFGAVFAAFTPAGETPERDAKPGHGEMSWHELMSTDYEKAFEFYAELFGWGKGEPMDMGPAGIYQLVRRGDADFGGMMNLPEGVPMSNWMYYINVEDIDAATAAVTANGGKILNGPMEVPGGDKIVTCMDPQGGAFSLHMFAQASAEA